MARLKVLDTNAMVAIALGTITVDSDVHVMISIITRIELLSWRLESEQARDDVRRLVDSVETVGIEEGVEAIAVQLRLQKRLKLPDAIIAATAMSQGVALVSGDRVFAKVEGLIVEPF